MSLKSALIFVLLAAATVVAAIFIMHYALPQTRNITQPLITFMTETAPAYVMQGWQWIAGSLAIITPIAIAAWAKISQARQLATAAQTQVSSVTSQVTELTNKATNLESTITSKDTTISELQNKLKEAEALTQESAPLISGLRSQVTSLEGKVQGAYDQHEQAIKGLMQNANGALWCDPMTGKTYSVLKLPPEIRIQ